MDDLSIKSYIFGFVTILETRQILSYCECMMESYAKCGCILLLLVYLTYCGVETITLGREGVLT